MTDIATLANNCFEQANGDIETTVAYLAEAVRNMPELHDKIIREWSQETVGRYCVREQRSKVWNQQGSTTGTSNERAKNFAKSILDFPLPGGKPLHLATREDLNNAIDFFDKQAKDMAWKARWLSRIRDNMGRKRTVGAAFDNESLQRLKALTEV